MNQNLEIKMKLPIIKILVGIILVLLIASGLLYNSWKSEKQERKRYQSNVIELTKTVDQANISIELGRKEFEKMNTAWKNRFDSVLTAAGKEISQVREYYELEISYRDSVDKPAQMVEAKPIEEKKIANTPIKPIGKPIYTIPFSQVDSCMWVKGNVTSTDPKSKVMITDKGYDNSGYLIALRSQFLGFLWWTKPTEYIAVSKCGETKYRHVKFVKK